MSSSDESQSKCIIVGIAGGTGSGKTTLTKGVYERLGGDKNSHVLMLSYDSYYKDQSDKPLEERAKTNFDHPDSLETELLIQHLQDLKDGKNVDIPHYDFATHSRIPNMVTKVTQSTTAEQRIQIILLEGILVLADERLLKEMDIKIYVDVDADIRFIRRLNRDTSERGRTVDDCCRQYLETVRPMHDLFVEPSKQKADMIVLSNNGQSLEVAQEALTNHLVTKTKTTSQQK